MSATTQLLPDLAGFIFQALRLSSGLVKSIFLKLPCWYSRTTLHIAPSSPFATRSRASFTIGNPEYVNGMARKRPFSAEIRESSSASSSESESGFSQTTSIPDSSAALAIS